MFLYRSSLAIGLLLFCASAHPAAQPLAGTHAPTTTVVDGTKAAEPEKPVQRSKLAIWGTNLWSRIKPCGRLGGALAVAASTVIAGGLLLHSHKSLHDRLPKNNAIALLPIGSLFFYGYLFHGKQEPKRDPKKPATIWQRILPSYDTLSTISTAIASGLSFIWTMTIYKPDLFKTAFDAANQGTVPNKTLDDYVGKIPASLNRAVNFIAQPEAYTSLGAKLPRGFVLCGPPGVGKSALAESIAGTLKVPFFACSGSDFIRTYVGTGAAAVDEIFASARTAAALHPSGKAVIFIDELDAVGTNRNNKGGELESKRTIDALLTQLQGVNNNDGIMVIAATNRFDDLDPALTRNGRLGDAIEIPYPDAEDRGSILTHYWKKLKKAVLSDERKREIVSDENMRNWSGADIEAAVNEAALIAGDAGANEVGDVHLQAGIEHVKQGKLRRRLQAPLVDREAYQQALLVAGRPRSRSAEDIKK